jgi:hypothetical protein
MPYYLRTRIDTFDVMAPEAVKRTTFHEHGGAYAWAVLGRKSLNVEYDSFSGAQD